MAAERETTPSPLAAAKLRGSLLKERLTEAGGGMLTVTEVSQCFGLSSERIEKHLRDGHVIAYEEEAGMRRLPACQFVERGILNGLPEVLSALPVVGFWTRFSFLLAELPEAGYRTPIEALRAGQTAAVVRAARRYGEQGAQADNS